MAGALMATGFAFGMPATASADTLQVTTIFPESDFSSTVLKRWAELVDERTDGKYSFRYHWAGALVGNKWPDPIGWSGFNLSS